MFDNIISQPTIQLLTQDIETSRLPQAILFAGPANSAKMTSALELARVVSCTEQAEWTCTCQSCTQMRAMTSVDLLIVGARDLLPEIKASAQTFLRKKTKGSHFLFSRSVKKLLIRFDHRLWDSDETRFTKAAPLISDIQLLLDAIVQDFPSIDDEKKYTAIAKSCQKIIDISEKIQNECMYSTLPINQVRKASEWLRHTPVGKQKFLILDSAEYMQEGARSAFLKILEEPPQHATFILISTRPAAIMQTILSRVRKYNFVKRSTEVENQVIERVFQDSSLPYNTQNPLENYFNTFLPVSFEKIKQAATEFWVCALGDTVVAERTGSSILRTSVAQLSAEKKTISQILSDIDKAKSKTVFEIFIKQILVVLQTALHSQTHIDALELENYKKATDEIYYWKKAQSVYNVSVQTALENIAIKLGELF